MIKELTEGQEQDVYRRALILFENGYTTMTFEDLLDRMRIKRIRELNGYPERGDTDRYDF